MTDLFNFICMEEMNLFISYSQWQGCWCSGDPGNQGIINHRVNLLYATYSSEFLILQNAC